MPILRNASRNRYTCLNNDLIMSEKLTCKNLGLLVRLLSLPDNWQFTEVGLSIILKADGLSSIRSGLKDLEKLGFLTRKRIRDDQGHLMDAEWTIRETPIPQEVAPAEKPQPVCQNPICENQILDSAILEPRIQSNTNISRTNKTNTNESLPSPFTPAETTLQMGGRKDVEEAIKENIEYDSLASESAGEVVDDIVRLMVDTVATASPTVRVNGTPLPANDVRKRFMMLGPDHIRYVIDAMLHGKSKIHNARAYLLTALYNSPTTIAAYYQSEAYHDLAENDDG